MPNRRVDVNSWRRSACYPRRTFYPLSDGPSIRNHRITRAYFRTCSTSRSRSQAPFCSCALRLVSNQPEGTFARLRYLLGGDRQSNYPPDNVPDPDNGSGLELQYDKGGISPLAPPKLALRLQSLPPILHITHRGSLPGCSKGAQGLSVFMRVTGIFTGTTDSLSPLWRQCPDRYAIRAGRNLPDKEFRYLRTVIVTAAVYRGFDSELRSPKRANTSS